MGPLSGVNPPGPVAARRAARDPRRLVILWHGCKDWHRNLLGQIVRRLPRAIFAAGAAPYTADCDHDGVTADKSPAASAGRWRFTQHADLRVDGVSGRLNAARVG
jgi:hypothetical protein